MVRLLLIVSMFFGMCAENIDNPYSDYESPDIMDTTLSSGKFLDYSLNADSILVMTWGDSIHGRVGAQLYDKWPMPMSPPWYLCEFDHYIALREDCGSPCWSMILLPTEKNDSIIVLEEDLVYDTKRGYVFGNNCANEDSSDFCLYDVNKHHHHPITLPGLRRDRDITQLLDSFSLGDKGLFLRWYRECDWGSGYEPVDTLIPLP